jgi:hypothetical protein
MRHRCLVSVAVGVISLLGATVAAGRGPASIPTQVVIAFQGATNGPNQFVLSASGPLISPVAKCEAGRTVKLFFRTAGGAKRLVDTDISSRHGQWGVIGRFPAAPQALIVAAARVRVEVHGRARTCAADRVVRPVSVVQPRM